MKKFLRALGVIAINVVVLPLEVIVMIIRLVLALYFEITSGNGKAFVKACIAGTISSTKVVVHWVKTGEWIW